MVTQSYVLHISSFVLRSLHQFWTSHPTITEVLLCLIRQAYFLCWNYLTMPHTRVREVIIQLWFQCAILIIWIFIWVLLHPLREVTIWRLSWFYRWDSSRIADKKTYQKGYMRAWSLLTNAHDSNPSLHLPHLHNAHLSCIVRVHHLIDTYTMLWRNRITQWLH